MIDIERTLRLLDVEAESNFVHAQAIDAINYLLRENARLRRAVKSAYYEGWQDNASIDDTEDRLHAEWACSEACAAIREGGKDG